MRRVLLMVAALAMVAGSAEAGSTRTKGYVKKNGTYVAPSYRTTPNRTKLDNYSTKGNTNPYSGKRGTKDPYKK